MTKIQNSKPVYDLEDFLVNSGKVKIAEMINFVPMFWSFGAWNLEFN